MDADPPAPAGGGIVLLVLSMTDAGENRNWLLSGGLLCSSLGIWLNIWFQRKEREEK